jgi:hypothetical protein
MDYAQKRAPTSHDMQASGLVVNAHPPWISYPIDIPLLSFFFTHPPAA